MSGKSVPEIQPRRVSTRSPTRIDFAGGTLDIWPLYLLLESPATVNVAINLYSEVDIEECDKWEVHEQDSDRLCTTTDRKSLLGQPGAELAASLLDYFDPRKPVRIRTRSDAPPHSGLGGSSSVGISIACALNAWTGAAKSDYELIQLVRDVEAEVLGGPTGEQDHFPPVYGGGQCIWWGKGAPKRDPIPIDTAELEAHVLLVYTHQPHRSGANNWQVVKRFLDGDRTTQDALNSIGHIAASMARALHNKAWPEVARLLGEEWDARRRLAPEVVSPELSHLMDAALEAGAKSVKACGAGGGGCFLVSVEESTRERVTGALQAEGGSILNYSISEAGARTVGDG